MLTKYPVKGPSSRYRFYQYLPALTKADHRFIIQPFFTDYYLSCLFQGRRVGGVYLFRCYAERLARCLSGRRFDLVWIEGELLPWLPGWVESWLHALLPRRRVYEFDDANWLRYEGKSLVEKKFDHILKSAAGVITGNSFLEAHVSPINANTIIIPTVVDWNRYADARPKPEGATIGWIGSPSTSFFLDQVFPALGKLARDYPVKLKLVGAEAEVQGFELETVPWSEDSEVRHIESFDIGIMPLTPTPWSEGKCGLKVVQYLATGVPAVASPVGVNTEYLQLSHGGYLAESEEDWIFSLRKLLDRPDLRRELGANGRDWVRREMTVTVQAPRLIAFLEECAG